MEMSWRHFSDGDVVGSGGERVNSIQEKYKFKYHLFLARKLSDPAAEDCNAIQQCYKCFN